jgi:2-polyprenyl-3-methyl-5-hydroxy-6-metoxy-1,4-benzoquinol methylase
MDLRENSQVDGVLEQHWYYNAKAKMLIAMLLKEPNKILDVGAGSGFFSKFLIRNTKCTSSICVDINYQNEYHENYSEGQIFYKKNIADANINVDLVLMMDVLEHVSDDVGLLREYAGRVSPGTYFLITVPAFNCLWSSHDIFLGHERRYTIASLERVIKKSGLKVIKKNYFFGFIFPLVLAVRLTKKVLGNIDSKSSDLRSHIGLVNKLLLWVCMIELKIFSSNRLAGLTVAFLVEA